MLWSSENIGRILSNLMLKLRFQNFKKDHKIRHWAAWEKYASDSTCLFRVSYILHSYQDSFMYRHLTQYQRGLLKFISHNKRTLFILFFNIEFILKWYKCILQNNHIERICFYTKTTFLHVWKKNVGKSNLQNDFCPG